MSKFLSKLSYQTAKSGFAFGLSAIALLIAFACGCADDGGGIAVHGDVQFAGQPVDSGEIKFLPTDGSGRVGVSALSAGAYRIPADQGLQPGEYFVSITAHRDTGRKARPSPYGGDTPQPITEQYIPRQFNEASTLKRTLEAGGDNKHDFDLTDSK